MTANNGTGISEGTIKGEMLGPLGPVIVLNRQGDCFPRLLSNAKHGYLEE